MDGAVTGQFANLPIEQLKISLGIWRSRTRDMDQAWRCIGYVKNFLPEKTRAKDLMRQSKHMDNMGYFSDSDDEFDNVPNEIDDDLAPDGDGPEEVMEDTEEVDDNEKIPSCNAQDLHTMLDTFLEGYRELQETGLDWDLPYNGEIHKVHFVFYVPFIKGDTVEHDKHCGSYNSRTKGVKQLCRYCCCPNDHTDDPYADYPRKTQTMIENLVDKLDDVELKNLSQQLIHNAWYKIRFGQHRPELGILGVHGACLIEALHWILLGKYKYLRQAFFEQIGAESKAAKRINELAKLMGMLLHRQSDRDKPRTCFSKGIMKGKLMGHEMRGVMLVLLTVLRTKSGRDLLVKQSKGKAKRNFGQESFVHDWIMLIETWLQFEEWLLSEDGILLHHCHLLKDKVRELMQMEIYVGKREKGMGYKTFNFHAAIHLAQDMIDHGSPCNVNTKSDEMHHKHSKTAAKRTQKQPEKFDFQVATRLHEQLLVEMADCELEGYPIWRYWDLPLQETKRKLEYVEPIKVDSSTITGTKVHYWWEDGDREKPKWEVVTKMKNKNKFKLDHHLLETLHGIYDACPDRMEYLTVFTEHHRNGEIFRASPYFLGHQWRDWCMVRWYNEEEGDDSDGDSDQCEDYVDLPFHLMAFVDLRMLGDDEVDGMAPAIYAIGESASKRNRRKEHFDEVDLSQLFTPYTKDIGGKDNNGQVKRKLYTVDTETITETAILVPDIGHSNVGEFLKLQPRKLWSEQFTDWLETPHDPNAFKE
jgi:hypothetical protein